MSHFVSLINPINPINPRPRLKFEGMGAIIDAAQYDLKMGQGLDQGADQALTPYAPPNILIILVDQMRTSEWYSEFSDWHYLPRISELRAKSLDFTEHYVAASPCSPSRACLLTGLYPHQHFMVRNVVDELIETYPPLDPRFPTYGTHLSQLGYQTAWFGKWHLSVDEWMCSPASNSPNQELLKSYGFDFCGYSSEKTHLGSRFDPGVVEAFSSWLGTQKTGPEPFCATVSLINPHDICYTNSTSLANHADDTPRTPIIAYTEKKPASCFFETAT